MSKDLILFISGGSCIALLANAVFFLRYWKSSRERLFAFFASGFLLLSLATLVRLYFGLEGDKLPNVYWLRFASYLLIILGILDKNLASKRSESTKE